MSRPLGDLAEALVAAGLPFSDLSAPPTDNLQGLYDSSTGMVVVAVDPGQQGQADAYVAGFDWSDVAGAEAANLREREVAIAGLDTSRQAVAKSDRAVASVLLDELNILRANWMSFKAATAAATSLADLKARVAALPDTPPRTMQQAAQALRNRLNDGTVDGG